MTDKGPPPAPAEPSLPRREPCGACGCLPERCPPFCAGWKGRVVARGFSREASQGTHAAFLPLCHSLLFLIASIRLRLRSRRVTKARPLKTCAFKGENALCSGDTVVTELRVKRWQRWTCWELGLPEKKMFFKGKKTEFSLQRRAEPHSGPAFAAGRAGASSRPFEGHAGHSRPGPGPVLRAQLMSVPFSF